MPNYNKAILVGHTGHTPEVKAVGTDHKVCRITLCTNSYRKGKESVPQWHTVILWDRLADTVKQYVGKGDPLMVEGRIEYRKYEPKEGGEKWITEIIADNIQLLKGKEGASQSSPGSEVPPQEDGSDLPF